MIRRENKNDQAQFGLILELTNQNKDAVVKLQSGYCMATATGNLIPVASGQSDGREQQGNMNRVGRQFTHFISVSIGGDKDLDLIKAFQDKFGEVPGIGRKKTPRRCTSHLGVSTSRKMRWRKPR